MDKTELLINNIFYGFSNDFTYLDNLFQSIGDTVMRTYYKIKNAFTGCGYHPLHFKRVIYVDRDMFNNEKYLELWLNTIKSSIEHVSVYDIDDYIYITSLNNGSRSDIKNPLFPNNLYGKIDNDENIFIIILFKRDHIGTDEFDVFIGGTDPLHECICTGKKEEYNLLQKLYIESEFYNVHYNSVS